MSSKRIIRRLALSIQYPIVAVAPKERRPIPTAIRLIDHDRSVVPLWSAEDDTAEKGVFRPNSSSRMNGLLAEFPVFFPFDRSH